MSCSYPEKRLERFGVVAHKGEEAADQTLIGRLLQRAGGWTFQWAKWILVGSALVAAIAVYGISRIQVNDNPTKWFRKSHSIRVADVVLNRHFGGTYEAYLALSPVDETPELPRAETLAPEREEETPELPAGLGLPEPEEPELPGGLGAETTGEPELPAGLGGAPSEEGPPPAPAQAPEMFKEPAVLRYMEGLQRYLLETGVVGKSNSIVDIVKTVHRELIDGQEASFRIPDTASAVAQCLMQYQSSHRPQDLWHFITPDYRHACIWLQLKSGDNLDMQLVSDKVAAYLEQRPMRFEVGGTPVELEPHWFGLTYINVVWQEKMVKGMLMSFLGSFAVVLLMMIVLFRSALWGLLSMIPLTITIGFIYGVIGLVGKDYDMPVAVLSSLTLGLAVDFAIHFLARSRAIYDQYGTWETTHLRAFGEPARAIFRNIIAIAVGFSPLLFAPLTPYNTVGIFMASILFVSGIGTLLILPALVRVLEPVMFPRTRVCLIGCHCVTCITTGVVTVAVVWINLYQFLTKGIAWLNGLSLAALPIIVMGCCLASCRGRRQPTTPPMAG